MRRKGRVVREITTVSKGGKGSATIQLTTWKKVPVSIPVLTDGPKAFMKACADRGVTPTARQLSKWKQKRGAARAV